MAISLAAGLIGLFAVSGVSIGGVVVYKMVESKQQARQEKVVLQQTQEVVEQTTTGQKVQASGKSELDGKIKDELDKSNSQVQYTPTDVQKELTDLSTQQSGYSTRFSQTQGSITSAENDHKSAVNVKQAALTGLWTEEEKRLQEKKTKLDGEVKAAQGSVTQLQTDVDNLKEAIGTSINDKFTA